VLVRTLTGKHHAFAFVKTGIVFDQTAPVYTFQSFKAFAILQSDFNRAWALNYGSTLETRMRYTPSDCFENFPLLNNMQLLDDIGERYYQHRQSIMFARQEGLTKTYNRFHDEQGLAGAHALALLHLEAHDRALQGRREGVRAEPIEVVEGEDRGRRRVALQRDGMRSDQRDARAGQLRSLLLAGAECLFLYVRPIFSSA